ncbi:MAG TPA: hypothetical protein VMR28_00555 [Candidatus Saccharimonadales bacterium]|nr:hypothetical protein [Candidatus Saccharimonadales bacterium]
MKSLKYSSKGSIYYILGLIVVIAVLLVIFVSLEKAHKTQPMAVDKSACTAQQFSVGSSGVCVKDIQTMANFIQTDGLTVCSLQGGHTLSISGQYDTATQNQVKLIQNWAQCYTHEEGSKATIPTNGIVAVNAWPVFCDYAYQFATHNPNSASPYTKATQQAGMNAGCSQ